MNLSTTQQNLRTKILPKHKIFVYIHEIRVQKKMKIEG